MKRNIFFCIIFGLFSACSLDSAKNHYSLAEKLWADQKYAPAVSEFDKVILKDPKSPLALKSLYKSAVTQALYLGQYNDAIQKFNLFIQTSNDEKLNWQAKLQIGDILYLKTEQYDQVILHYQALLKEKPEAPEAPEVFFRVGKSQFFTLHFKEAISSFQDLIKKYPDSQWAEKAYFEIGTSFFTQGAQRERESNSDSALYKEAIRAYEKAIKVYPTSDLVPDARFGIASCLEELDQLEESYEAYLALRDVYPSPQVIEVKLARIKERISQRKDTH